MKYCLRILQRGRHDICQTFYTSTFSKILNFTREKACKLRHISDSRCGICVNVTHSKIQTWNFDWKFTYFQKNSYHINIDMQLMFCIFRIKFPEQEEKTPEVCLLGFCSILHPKYFPCKADPLWPKGVRWCGRYETFVCGARDKAEGGWNHFAPEGLQGRWVASLRKRNVVKSEKK